MGDGVTKRDGVDYANASDVPSGQTKAAIDALAAEYATKIGHKAGQPVERSIAGLGGVVVYQDTAESPDGGYVIVHAPRDFGVVLSTWTSPRRDQFTMAHELGHYVLHSQHGKRPLFAARTGTGRSEWEANWFAAGFLMPESEFRRAVSERLGESALAAKFGTSVQAIQIRKKALGL